jgi:hypothetical protein
MIARHFHAHLDAAEFSRIEAKLEARIAAIEAADDLASNLRGRRRRALRAAINRRVLNVGAGLRGARRDRVALSDL